MIDWCSGGGSVLMVVAGAVMNVAEMMCVCVHVCNNGVVVCWGGCDKDRR